MLSVHLTTEVVDQRAGQVGCAELFRVALPTRGMNANTVVSNPVEDRAACEQDCKRIEAGLAEIKAQNSWMTYDDYAHWILSNQPVIPRA